jgi:hypothetical protein
MKCYYTGEDCDCGGDLETDCPHDEMPDDFDCETDDDLKDFHSVENRFSDMSHQLELK